MGRFKIFLVLISLFVLLLIFVGMHYSFGVYFNPLMEEFGWTKTTTSSIFSLYMFLYTFIQWFMGGMMDRYPYYKVIGISAFLYSFSLVLISLTTSLWQLYLSFGVLSALGMGGIYVPSVTVVNKVFRNKRGLALGTVLTGSGFGMLLISPLTRLLIDLFNWRFSYRVFALTGLLTGTLVALILKNVFMEVDVDRGRSVSERKSVGQGELEGLSLRKAAETLHLWILTVTNFLFITASAMVIVHLVPYVLDLNLSGMVAAMGLGLVGIGRVFGSLGIGWLSDKISPKRSLIICIMVLGMIMLLLPSMNSKLHLYTLSIFFGIIYAGGIIMFPAISVDLFGQKSAGSIYGLVNIGYGLGCMAGPLLGGIAYDFYGTYSAAFYSGLIISAAAVVLLTSLLRSPVKYKPHLQ